MALKRLFEENCLHCGKKQTGREVSNNRIWWTPCYCKQLPNYPVDYPRLLYKKDINKTKMDTKPLKSLDYKAPQITKCVVPNNPNIELIESIQKKITEINEDLRAICGKSDDLIKCKTDALETVDIFDKVDIRNLLAAIKRE